MTYNYKYTRTFLTGISKIEEGYSTMKIIRSQTNWRILDWIYGIIIPRLRGWHQVPHTFDTPEEVRKFLNEKGVYNFNIIDMRPDEDLK